MDSNKKLRDSIVSGLVWKFGERVLARGVTFLVSLVVARILAPEDYGVVAMVLVFVTLADVFVTSGFATGLIRKKDADEVDFSTMFYCALVCSLVLYGVLYFCAPLIAAFYKMPDLIPVVRVFSLRVPLSVYNSIQHAYVSRHMLFKRFFWSTLIGTVLSGVVGIVMARQGFGVWALIGQYFTNTVIDTMVLQVTVPWHPTRRFSLSAAKPLMGYGWKVLAADLSGTFFTQLRNLVIGRVYTSADLAYYNKGQQFPTLLTDNISASVISVLFPAISNVGDDAERAKLIIRKAIQIMSYVIFPLMCGMAVVARPMIRIVLTDKWLDCVPYLQMMCACATISLIGDTSLQAIKAIGRSDVLLKIEFIKKPVYVLLLFWGLKTGVMMIAVTMVIYSVYATAINAAQLKKYLNYRFGEQMRDALPALALSAVMGACIYALSFLALPDGLLLFAQVVSGAAVYVALSGLLHVETFFYLKNAIKERFGRR